MRFPQLFTLIFLSLTPKSFSYQIKPSVTLNCAFESTDYKSESLYTCISNDFNSDKKNTKISDVLIIGNHQEGVSNKNVEAFFVEYQNLEFLPSNLFEFFPNLVKVEISSTLLQEIVCKNFLNLHLEILKLNDNKIKIIDGRALEDQNNLKEIYLDHNKIEELPDNFFSFSPNLEIINVEHNQIKSWNENLLKNLKNLKEIYLQDNKIAKLEANFFNQNLNLQIVKLKDNIKCENGEIFIETLKKLQAESVDEISEICQETFIKDHPNDNTIEDMNYQMSILNSENIHLKDSLEKEMANYKDLSQNVDELKRELEENKRSIAKLSIHNEELSKSVKNYKNSNVTSAEKINSLTIENLEFSNQIQLLKETNANISSSFQVKIEKCHQSLDEAQSQNKNCSDTIDALKNEQAINGIQMDQRRDFGFASECERFKTDFNNCENDLLTFKHREQSTSDKNIELSLDIETISNQLINCQNSNNSCTDRLSNLKIEHDDCMMNHRECSTPQSYPTCNVINTKYEECAKTVEFYKTERYNSVLIRADHCEDELRNYKNLNERYSMEIMRQSTQLETLRCEAESVKNLAIKLRAIIDSRNTEIDICLAESETCQTSIRSYEKLEASFRNQVQVQECPCDNEQPDINQIEIYKRVNVSQSEYVQTLLGRAENCCNEVQVEKRQISECTKKINFLSLQVEEYKSRIELSQKMNFTYEENVKNLTHKVEECFSMCQECETQNFTCCHELDVVNIKTVELESKIKVHEIMNETYINQSSNYTSQIEECYNNIHELQSINSTYVSEISSLKTKIKEYSNLIKLHESMNSTNIENIKNLTQRIQNYSNDLHACKNTSISIIHNHTSIANKNKELTKQIEIYKKINETHVKRLMDEEKKVDKCSTEIKSYKSESFSSSETIRKLSLEVSESLKQIEISRSMNKTYFEKINELIYENQELQSQISSCQTSNLTCVNNYKSYESQIEVYTNQIQACRNSNTSCTNNVNSLSYNNQQCHKNLQVYQNSVLSFKNEVRALENENRNCNTKINQCDRNLKTFQHGSGFCLSARFPRHSSNEAATCNKVIDFLNTTIVENKIWQDKMIKNLEDEKNILELELEELRAKKVDCQKSSKLVEVFDEERREVPNSSLKLIDQNNCTLTEAFWNQKYKEINSSLERCQRSLKHYQSFTLECKFSIHNSVYECLAAKVVANARYMEISGVRGEHVIGKNNQNVESLKIVNSVFTYFTNNVFKHFVNLKSLEIFNSSLSDLINPKIDSKILTKLQVEFNNIKKIYKKTFDNVKELRELILISNGIEEIENGAFSELSKLQKLDLSKNQISSLSGGTFNGLKELRFVSVAENNLKALPEFLLKYLPNLQIVKFNENPIKIIELNFLNFSNSGRKYFELDFTKTCADITTEKIDELKMEIEKKCRG